MEGSARTILVVQKIPPCHPAPTAENSLIVAATVPWSPSWSGPDDLSIPSHSGQGVGRTNYLEGAQTHRPSEPMFIHADPLFLLTILVGLIVIPLAAVFAPADSVIASRCDRVLLVISSESCLLAGLTAWLVPYHWGSFLLFAVGMGMATIVCVRLLSGDRRTEDTESHQDPAR